MSRKMSGIFTWNDLTHRHKKVQKRYVEEARVDDPDGIQCQFCGKLNDFADDCGWFYIRPSKNEEGYCCESCYDGEPGKKHIEIYGLGER